MIEAAKPHQWRGVYASSRKTVLGAPRRREYSNSNHREFAMAVIPDKTAFQTSLASLPVVTYQPGETVIAYGSKTGRLLIRKKGTVAIVKEDTEIAKVAEPGAVFGEL